jgi:hypothetical protein
MTGRFSIFRNLVLGILFVLAGFTCSAAGVVEDVARDFSPLSGVVIMPAGDEFLIDLDASQGVTVGDLFSVVRPGEKVIHPVTKEILGSLDEVKGALQVTSIKSGYSYAKALEGAEAIGKSDAIRRFESIEAVFLDYTGEGEALYSKIRDALPHLEWSDYAAAQLSRSEVPAASPQGRTALVFVLKAEGLEVRGPQFQILHAYDLPVSVGPAPLVRTQEPAAPPASGIIVSSQAQAKDSSAVLAKGIWISQAMEGTSTGLEVADLDGDGRMETAVAFPHRLEIGRLAEGQYTPLETLELGSSEALSLDGADLDGDGKTELYVTAASGEILSSLVVEHVEGSYQIGLSDISWYFRKVHLPQEGPVLLAQRMGLQSDFQGPIFRVSRAKGKLLEGSPIAVPPQVNLFGFVPFTSDGEQLFANLPTSDRLEILQSDGMKLWESEEHFGGSETYLERTDVVTGGDVTRYLFRQARIERGEGAEILVPVNEGSRLFPRSREFSKSRLKAMVWNGFDLAEAWSTKPQFGYLADFRLADADNDGQKEVVMAVGFSGKLKFLSQKRSSLVVYELQ